MEVKHEYALETTTALPNQRFDAIVLGGTCILDLDLTFCKMILVCCMTLKFWVKCGWEVVVITDVLIRILTEKNVEIIHK
jgi:hypothetical protein